ncbi:MAG: hypothetical protein QXR26_04425 [Candidatus Caldarchaeum sp.]
MRALGVRLYVEGLSLRKVAGILGGLGFKVSHGSVRDWFNRAGEAFSSIARRGPIAVDETVIHNLARIGLHGTYEGSGLEEEGGDVRQEKHDRVLVQQTQEEDKTVQHIPPNIQA